MKAVLPQGNRAMPKLFSGLKFANNMLTVLHVSA